MITHEQRIEQVRFCSDIRYLLFAIRDMALRRRVPLSPIDVELTRAIDAVNKLERYLRKDKDHIRPRLVIQTAASVEHCLAQLCATHFVELGEVRQGVRQLGAIYSRDTDPQDANAQVTWHTTISRRARSATYLAVRLLPPADRARYRQEFAAELADLPRADQAPYAMRQVFRAWSLRHSLSGRSSRRFSCIVATVVAGTDSIAGLVKLDWPAAVFGGVVALGGVIVIAVMLTINSQDRTRRLATLIRAVRSRPASTRKR